MPPARTLRFAVLIPVYNSESTIRDTLLSLQAQDGPWDDVVGVTLADDASRDNGLAIAQSAWTSPAPLRILRNPHNQGERSNVNRAMALLAGEADWVFLLHADDLVKPHWMTTLMAQARACDPSVASICSSWDTLWPDGRVEPGEDNPARPVELVRGTAEAVRSTLLRGCWWHLSGCLIRTQAFAEIGGFVPDMPQLGDYDWLLRCLRSGRSIEYVPRTLLVYRQHPQSVSSLSFLQDRDIRERLRILRGHRAYLARRDLLRLHAHMLGALARRAARAVLRLAPGRLVRVAHTALLVVKSLLVSLPGNPRASQAAPSLSGDPAP